MNVFAQSQLRKDNITFVVFFYYLLKIVGFFFIKYYSYGQDIDDKNKKLSLSLLLLCILHYTSVTEDI